MQLSVEARRRSRALEMGIMGSCELAILGVRNQIAVLSKRRNSSLGAISPTSLNHYLSLIKVMITDHVQTIQSLLDAHSEL